MAISDNKTLYFDRATRTKQTQIINALAHATYHSKGNKNDIIKNLGIYLDNLSDRGKGVYGKYPNKIKNQFMSKYTLGLEFGVWKYIDRENMILTDLAVKMVEEKITPEYYISNVLLNYYQIIDNNVVNPLYSTLLFMDRTSKSVLYKEDINNIEEFNLDKEERDNRNIWYHILGETVFFNKSNYDDELIWNSKLFNMNEVIDRCNTNLLFLDNKVVREEYSDQKFYAEYITQNNKLMEEMH